MRPSALHQAHDLVARKARLVAQVGLSYDVRGRRPEDWNIVKLALLELAKLEMQGSLF